MTVVHISLKRDTAVSTAGIRGHLLWEPTSRREDGTDVVLEEGFPVPLVAGEATVTVAPSGLTWCWRVTERIPRGIVRYVLVPDSLDIVEYVALVDVDPTTLAATAEPEAAWWAAWQAMASGTYLVSDPSNPGLYIPTAGTAMVEDPANDGLYTIGTLV